MSSPSEPLVTAKGLAAFVVYLLARLSAENDAVKVDGVHFPVRTALGAVAVHADGPIFAPLDGSGPLKVPKTFKVFGIDEGGIALRKGDYAKIWGAYDFHAGRNARYTTAGS